MARSPLSMGEFFKQLALVLQRDNVKMPLEDQQRWHLLFYELKKSRDREGRPEFLDRLRFDWDGPTPKSGDLSSFLQSLHANASLSARNPQFTEFVLREDTADYVAAASTGLDERTKAFIDYAARRAKDAFVR
jgi:hypothetical protein